MCHALMTCCILQADAAAQNAKGIKEECEGILAEAMPALAAAVSALDTIRSADIKLVQSFKNPPAAVKLIMEAVCVMLDVKPTMVPDPNMAGKKLTDYWDASKKLLMDAGFLQRLKDYDRDNIPHRIMDKVHQHGKMYRTPACVLEAFPKLNGEARVAIPAGCFGNTCMWTLLSLLEGWGKSMGTQSLDLLRQLHIYLQRHWRTSMYLVALSFSTLSNMCASCRSVSSTPQMQTSRLPMPPRPHPLLRACASGCMPWTATTEWPR